MTTVTQLPTDLKSSAGPADKTHSMGPARTFGDLTFLGTLNDAGHSW